MSTAAPVHRETEPMALTADLSPTPTHTVLFVVQVGYPLQYRGPAGVCHSPLWVSVLVQGAGRVSLRYPGPHVRPVTRMQGSSLPAGRCREEITSGMKEEVSAHQERREAPVLSGAEPPCLSGPGSALQ